MPEAYLNSGPTLFLSSCSVPLPGSPQPHPNHSPSPRDVDKKPHLLEDVLLIEESAVLWRENTHGEPLEPYSHRVPSHSPGPRKKSAYYSILVPPQRRQLILVGPDDVSISF